MKIEDTDNYCIGHIRNTGIYVVKQYNGLQWRMDVVEVNVYEYPVKRGVAMGNQKYLKIIETINDSPIDWKLSVWYKQL
jgi:hypothetical protein